MARMASKTVTSKPFVAIVATTAAVSARAATDITGVIDDVDGYYTAAAGVGIAVLLFVLGRAIVRKVAK